VSGLCGIVSFDGSSVDPAIIQRMLEAARHRGPDGVSCWTRWNAALGHLRLDLNHGSGSESWPCTNPSGEIVLTASARLDNHSDLERRLSVNKTGSGSCVSDAEWILAAYETWGRECPRHLVGDYAFAIWDARRRGLFAARDPMGFRALYYRHEPGRLLLSSEVKQILAVHDVASGLDERAVAVHLAMGNQHPEWTFFEGIHQLPPGHALWCDRRGIHVWRFWDAAPERCIEYRSEDEYAEHFREIFVESVRARLRCRKPVGVWLSGGLDSGSVASTAGWLANESPSGSIPQIHTYSWIFETLLQCDERHISDLIAAHYRMPARYISAEAHAPFQKLASLVTDADEPLVQVYSPLLHRALRSAKDDGVGLILTGFRGDALLARGRLDTADLLVRGRWGELWRALRAAKSRTGRSMSSLMTTRVLRPLAASLARSNPLGAAMVDTFHPSREHQTPYPSWVRRELAKRVDLEETIRTRVPRPPLRGPARRDRYFNIFHPLYFRAAVEQERHNASFGIGYADPWSDRRLAEFVLAVPQHVLSSTGEQKRLTRVAMRGIMPENARQSARKIVPTPLFQRVIRRDAEAPIAELIRAPKLAERGWVDAARLRAYYEAYLAGGPEDPRFWFTLTAEMWLRRHWS
jgi:asparagine synthase (glutamine-hydrolysing)